MSVVGSVKALFLADTSGLEQGAAKAKATMERMGQSARASASAASKASEGWGEMAAAMGKLAAVAAAVKLAMAAKDAALKFEKLAASGRTLGMIFGPASEQIKATMEQLAHGLGVSRVESAQAAIQIGANLTNAGIQAGEAAKRTAGLLKLAVDMAAATGNSASDAVTAIASALRGEYDPIEKFGVGIKAAAVEQMLLSQGVKKIDGEFDQQSKTLATLNLLLNQTAKYQGSAVANSDTATGAIGQLTGAFEKFSLHMGYQVAPVIKVVAQSITGLVWGINKALSVFEKLQYHIYKYYGGMASEKAWRGEDKVIQAAKVEGVITREKMEQLAAEKAAAKVREDAAEKMQKSAADLKDKAWKVQTDKLLKASSERHDLIAKMKEEAVAKSYGANSDVMNLFKLRGQLGNSEIMSMAKNMDFVNNLKDNRIQPDAFQARSANMAEAGTQAFYKLQLSAQGYDRTPEKDTAKNTSKMADTLDKMLTALERGDLTPELANF